MGDYSCSAKCKNGGASYTAGEGIAIEDNVITNTAPGEIYTAGTGISISDENVISNDAILTAGYGIGISAENAVSLKGWTQVTSADWSVFKDSDGFVTEDLLFMWFGGVGGSATQIFVPKGIYPNYLVWQIISPITAVKFTLQSAFVSSGNISANMQSAVIEDGALTTTTSVATVNRKTGSHTGLTSGLYLFKRV